ncbi:translation initiation factor eIF4A [Lunasporangiospora selenospora]|uniref:ATP-dependent RNA helicase n=1 Tax=Lunasporangiospora selenospora TaxID=979761 RepID=A0A9P6FTR0_9FUNG|nr:translation initiation factor eIF4A [Lunasporangiospora selenospora]
MSAMSLAELSLSVCHVQTLLARITEEVKVLSDGLAALVDEGDGCDSDAELKYLDVDPWSKVGNKEKTAVAASTRRQDSIRSLLQRRPSTVKDETKALARILSKKRPGTQDNATSSPNGNTLAATGLGSTGTINGGNLSDSERRPSPLTGVSTSRRVLEQTIDEDSTGSESSPPSFYYLHQQSSQEKLDSTVNNNDTSGLGPTMRAPGMAESVCAPQTITVQTTNHIPKYNVAISKPSQQPQSPSTPILSTSSSYSSIMGSNPNNNTSNHNSNNGVSVSNGGGTTPTGGPPQFWRSSTTPVGVSLSAEASRPNSMVGMSGYMADISNGIIPDSRSNSEIALSHSQSSIADRYTHAIRTSSQTAITPTSLGRDTVKSNYTVRSPIPSGPLAQADKTEATDCFSKLGLSPELLRGIYAYGLKLPSILQQRGIPMIMTRHDVLVQAKPEVAKTLTFVIPLLHSLTLPATSIHPQLVILCSNNDLCLHVQRVLLALARFMPTISCLISAEGNNATLSLGTISSTQVNTSSTNNGPRNSQGGRGYGYNSRGNTSPVESMPVIAAHVVIGTPNKVLNLVRTKQINLAALKVFVLENADILLTAPQKEATISLLSMIRENNTSVLGVPNQGSNGAVSTGGAGAGPLMTPPNSSPTSPVSMAVAALNGRIINSSASTTGISSRLSGSFGEIESRPRSTSSASLSAPVTPLSGPLGTSPGSGATTTQPVQLLFFSTMVPPYVLDFVSQYMIQPTKALVKGHDMALKGILQFFKYMTVARDDDARWRLETLCELLEESGAHRAIVFCNRDETVDRVVRKIRERKGTAVGLFSDMDIGTRTLALGKFRMSPPNSYLVMTDEVSWDMEAYGVPLVVSFEIPTVQNYIPRVKWVDRSGGKVGVKVTIVDGQRGEGQAIRLIQQHYRTTIDDMPTSIAELIVN